MKKSLRQSCYISIENNENIGYQLFNIAYLINILNKYKDWKVIVAGNEKREFYDFKHERLKIYDWLSHKQIINIYKKNF